MSEFGMNLRSRPSKVQEEPKKAKRGSGRGRGRIHGSGCGSTTRTSDNSRSVNPDNIDIDQLADNFSDAFRNPSPTPESVASSRSQRKKLPPIKNSPRNSIWEKTRGAEILGESSDLEEVPFRFDPRCGTTG